MSEKVFRAYSLESLSRYYERVNLIQRNDTVVADASSCAQDFLLDRLNEVFRLFFLFKLPEKSWLGKLLIMGFAFDQDLIFYFLIEFFHRIDHCWHVYLTVLSFTKLIQPLTLVHVNRVNFISNISIHFTNMAL